MCTQSALEHIIAHLQPQQAVSELWIRWDDGYQTTHTHKHTLKPRATCPDRRPAVIAPLHESFQKRVKHSYKLIHKCKNIIQHGNE